MTTTSVRQFLEDKETTLSPYATRSIEGLRDLEEEPCLTRTEFQRDRDRILHSKSFRRLKHKTQVFIAPAGDHFVTRLTHTLEVAQVARTIARALNLNEDLTEAVALGHDIGHTPFGHIGEEELNTLYHGGFRHAYQSLRLVEQLEKDGAGLNLTKQVREGIVSHSKPKGNLMGGNEPDQLSLEGQACRVADAIAYLNHDLADAFRAGAIDPQDLPPEVTSVLGSKHSQRIDTMVRDIVCTSWSVRGEDSVTHRYRPSIKMSAPVLEAANLLRNFMFGQVYIPESRGEEGRNAREVVRLLFDYYNKNPKEILGPDNGDGRLVVDHIANMTDYYALRDAERVKPGIVTGLKRALV